MTWVSSSKQLHCTMMLCSFYIPSSSLDDATGISVGIVVIVFICGGVLVLVLVLVLGLWCRNRKHKVCA